MSAWPGKYVIGLTGNIATGKSVVRKMLEHQGVYGIDADALGHRAIAKDAPGYAQVIATFGRYILGEDEQIDRAKLARVVFLDAQALQSLEAIVHPLVRQAVDVLVRRASQRVVVIEAIKLLEGPLRKTCDSIWVTYSPFEVQLARLTKKRGMTEEAARQRILAQPAQEEKLASANIVIQNVGSFEDVWRQVLAAWQTGVPSQARAVLAEAAQAEQPTPAQGQMSVNRARPKEASEIAEFINRTSDGQRKLQTEDIMEAFGEKAFMLVKLDGRIIGLMGWQVENLVARTNDVYFEPQVSLKAVVPMLMREVEAASRDLQCEASLLFLPPSLARQEELWQELSYEQRSAQSLGVRAWQEAAQETQAGGEVMLFKQLRKDRVLRPV